MVTKGKELIERKDKEGRQTIATGGTKERKRRKEELLSIIHRMEEEERKARHKTCGGMYCYSKAV